MSGRYKHTLHSSLAGGGVNETRFVYLCHLIFDFSKGVDSLYPILCWSDFPVLKFY